MKLFILLSVWDLISLTSNWDFCGSRRLVPSQAEQERSGFSVTRKEEKKPPEKKRHYRLKDVEVRLQK